MGFFSDQMVGDDGFDEFLQKVIDMEHLEDAALGITKQVIGKGMESLSEKQKHVFQIHVLDVFTIPECSRGGCDIPWSEMYDAATDHGMCSWCWHMSQKDD